MDIETTNKNEWQQAGNWSRMGLFGIYFSKADTRLFVPKATPAFGWTLNFGHRHAVPWLSALILLPVVFTVAILSIFTK